MGSKKNYYKPNTLMSVHGFKSKGKWQDKLSTTLSRHKIKSAPFKYGYKIWPGFVNKEVEKFKDWYFRTVNDREYDLMIEKPFHRPSIIAHSLGTWIIAKALIKYPEIKFDKIYLVGSIIPDDFDWYKVILNDQVSNVYYETAMRDWVVKLSFVFTKSFRPSGMYGFVQPSSFLQEVLLENFDHSDFDYDAHFKKYVYPRLKKSPHQLEIVEGGRIELKELNKIFKESFKIDMNVFDKEYAENPITVEIARSWAKVEPDIWSFVKHVYRDKIIGYINAVPVDEETYKAFIVGKKNETEIKIQDILDYSGPKNYHLLVLAVVIEGAGLSSGRVAEMLILSFIYKIQRLKRTGLNLQKFAACAYTDEGERLCKGFKMTLLPCKNGTHHLYEVNVAQKKEIEDKELNFMAKWWYKSLE